ncbi:capsid protein [Chestnut teal chaphamaparvovirus 1]|uniref:Capsid protein n=1 Tax=Chestnut teal chaphamaparvovirus 1 TaxID=2759403 RepID=A0A7D7B3B3_9VIRU|nr:capsid protein [Chestnut teal chaphamaparvovirus 1]QMI57831.1 capsid protein [Chestnut teal chaphamaparvovirus 1]
MTETIAFQNVYMTYIDNNPYEYPSIDVDQQVSGATTESDEINTGWHIIPNFLWRHCCIPRQWASLVTGCEAYQIKSIKGIIYNPIPITTNISLQRVSMFSAFNNCTYAMTYTDDKYETSWYPWNNLQKKYQLHLSQREGLIWTGTQASSGSTSQHNAARYQWPIYKWRRPNMKTIINDVWSQGKVGQAGVYDVDATDTTNFTTPTQVAPSGIFWDPFNCPDEIGELRAGKNSIDFSWTPANCDKDKWFNLDQIASFTEWTTDGPYCGQGRPWNLKTTTGMDPQYASTYGLAEKQATAASSNVKLYQDYTVPNWFQMPIAPTKWFWKELQQSVIDWDEGETSENTPQPKCKMANKYWPGTEWEAFTYSPSQWFCKGIPLYDASNNPIKTTTQVSFQITLTLEGRKRRSAYFAPTHGPWSGDQLYYQSNRRGIFQPAMIRYKTGGKRRTWQNIATLWKIGQTNTDPSATNRQNILEHQRQNPFWWKVNQTQNAFGGEAQYNDKHMPTGIKDKDGANRVATQVPNIKIRWTKETDETEIIMEEEEQEQEEEERTQQQSRKRGSSAMKLLGF